MFHTIQSGSGLCHLIYGGSIAMQPFRPHPAGGGRYTQGGMGKRPRAIRQCRRCIEYNGVHSFECIGRTGRGRRHCEYFDASGKMVACGKCQSSGCTGGRYGDNCITNDVSENCNATHQKKRKLLHDCPPPTRIMDQRDSNNYRSVEIDREQLQLQINLNRQKAALENERNALDQRKNALDEEQEKLQKGRDELNHQKSELKHERFDLDRRKNALDEERQQLAARQQTIQGGIDELAIIASLFSQRPQQSALGLKNALDNLKQPCSELTKKGAEICKVKLQLKNECDALDQRKTALDRRQQQLFLKEKTILDEGDYFVTEKELLPDWYDDFYNADLSVAQFS